MVIGRNKAVSLIFISNLAVTLISANVKGFYIAGNRLLTHTLFWTGYLLAYTGVHTNADYSLWTYFIYEAMGLPAAMLVAYVNLYILYPRLFARKKYTMYILLATVLLFLCSLLSRVLIEWVLEPLFFPATTTREAIFIWYLLFKGMLWFLSPILLFTLVVKVLQQWFIQERLHQQIAGEQLRSELNFLKAQVHPHFLFNTLNNLYALTLQASPAAPKVVLKLSDMMSYMLYDSQSGLIALDKEIQHIRDYIELEKLRYAERLDVSLTISGDTAQHQLAPLLLIPFVENAFKHGVSLEADDVWVTIDIKTKAGWLNMKIENSCTEMPYNTGDKQGIGLQNVQRRLALLYPQLHSLTLSKEPGRYIADLKFKLS